MRAPDLRWRQSATLGVVLIGAIALAGCGSSKSASTTVTADATKSVASSTAASVASSSAGSAAAAKISCGLSQQDVNSATGRSIPVNPATADETSGCNWIDRSTGSYISVNISPFPASASIPTTAPAFPGLGRFTTYYTDPAHLGQCFDHTCQLSASVTLSATDAEIGVYLSPSAADPMAVAKALLAAIVSHSS